MRLKCSLGKKIVRLTQTHETSNSILQSISATLIVWPASPIAAMTSIVRSINFSLDA